MHLLTKISLIYFFSSRVWHELENGNDGANSVDHSIKPVAAERPRKRLGGGVRY